MLTPGSGVLVDVEAAGVSFPEVLQTRGEYQLKPSMPFVPGSEVAGIVREAPDDAGVSVGDRVGLPGARLRRGRRLAGLPDLQAPRRAGFRQGAALILNYHTAWFSLVTRGRLVAGETVLVHGAAGGVGTASIQVAKGLGADVIAVVSTDAEGSRRPRGGSRRGRSLRRRVARGGQGAVRGGVDLVLDPVGGDRFTDSLRSLAEGGRVVVVGFTEGSIPEVKVNRLLLNNTEVIGAGWGGYVMSKPDLNREIGAELDRLIASGHVRPNRRRASFPFGVHGAVQALKTIDERRATGKVVLDVR